MIYSRIQLIYVAALILLCCPAAKLQAQVTIGSGNTPVKAALLEIKTQSPDADNVTSTTGGLGLSRVQLENKYTLEPFIKPGDAEWAAGTTQNETKKNHTGLMVYNLTSNLTTETEPAKRFRQGLYLWNGTQWNFVSEGFGQRYFFIPSFNIPITGITPDGNTETIDLYAQYKTQFTADNEDSNVNPTFVSSNAALKRVPSPGFDKLYERTDLDYVITYYDPTVMSDVAINANGVMTYKIISLDTSPASFINVVFVIKEERMN
ncbi:hypothetical protein D0T84_12170 [Dysgonomonas sp. 521]|uniref:hypothetical protein n=1 Tax=Dysgonomonas sp. 521 TaxID=2302932 RepID=UPI0013D7DA6C|nr:hypothetical protein [Dysgonomonas sp. 521]NDV95663.1 hypothetical protein [Dysgonomonas sp. 521]